MDSLNVIVAIHAQTGLEIPEREHGNPSTLDDAVAYLSQARTQGAGA